MKIKCLVMCANSEGSADCVPVIVECTEDEYNEGVHYDAAEGICSENGYEPNFKIFDEFEFGNLARVLNVSTEKLIEMINWSEAEETWTGTE